MSVQVLLTFGVVLAIVVGTYWLLIGREEAAEQASLRKRLKATRVSGPAAANRTGLLRTERPLSEIPWLNTLLAAFRSISGPAHDLIKASDVNLTVGSLLLTCAVVWAFVLAVLWQVSGSVLLGMVIGVPAAFLPVLVLRILAQRRMDKFEEQFPEAIDLTSRALKAGHAFTTALSLVAEEMPDPVGAEFKLAFDRQNFGMPLPDALRALGDRVPLVDARFFVTAVLTQRDVGGNLSEVLENLANVIRERFRVKRQVRVITAHARMTAWVLGIMPPLLAVVMAFVSPENLSVLWTHPTGVKMVVGAVLLQITGTLIISRLVKIEY
jgi:tight adherence protein B